MSQSSVLLWIESVLAIGFANFKDRKSNSGFSSIVFQVVSHVPAVGRVAAVRDVRSLRWKIC
jgi:hypothetical protein